MRPKGLFKYPIRNVISPQVLKDAPIIGTLPTGGLHEMVFDRASNSQYLPVFA